MHLNHVTGGIIFDSEISNQPLLSLSIIGSTRLLVNKTGIVVLHLRTLDLGSIGYRAGLQLGIGNRT